MCECPFTLYRAAKAGILINITRKTDFMAIIRRRRGRKRKMKRKEEERKRSKKVIL